MAESTNDDQRSEDGYPRLRREPRTRATIRLSVSGFDEFGHFFHEHTATFNVSANGCCFRLIAEVEPDALLALQSVDGEGGLPRHPAFYQVTWREVSDPGAVVGAARTDGGLAAPPAPSGETQEN
jgi:hypothetical protein